MSTSTSGPAIPASIAPAGLPTVGRGLDGHQLLSNHDFDSLHLVVAHAMRVPRRVERLNVPGRVGRAAAQLVLPRPIDVPCKAPGLPGERPVVFPQLGIRPGPSAVGADLDAHDAPPARPRPTFEDA